MSPELRILQYLTANPGWKFGQDIASVSLRWWHGSVYIYLSRLVDAGFVEFREPHRPGDRFRWRAIYTERAK